MRTTTVVCDSCSTVIKVLDEHDDPLDTNQIGIYVAKSHKRVWELCRRCVRKAEAAMTKVVGPGQPEQIKPSLGEFIAKLTGTEKPEPEPMEVN